MRALRLGLTALALGLMAGCGSQSPFPAKVSGKVTYNGKPVPAGTIVFQVQGQSNYPAVLGADGSYQLSELPAGDLVVTVETESVNPEKKAPAYGGGRGAKIDKEYQDKMVRPASGSTQQQYVKIPAKYARPDTSGLTVTLKAGKQTKDFDLKD